MKQRERANGFIKSLPKFAQCLGTFLISIGGDDDVAPRQQGTVIAKGLKIVGSVTAEGLVEVNGQIEGELHCTSLVIARGAHITESLQPNASLLMGKLRVRFRGVRSF